MCIQKKKEKIKKVKLYKKQVKFSCYNEYIKKIKGVDFMLPLVIQLGSIIVGSVMAKEIKKQWEED